MGKEQLTYQNHTNKDYKVASYFTNASLDTKIHVTLSKDPPKLIDSTRKDSRYFYLARDDSSEKEVAYEPSSLKEFMTRFDEEPESYGLESDWYNLRSTLGQEVGFSLKSMMDDLPATDPDNLSVWKQKASYSVAGYTLEYLSKHVVYPCKYERSTEDPRKIVDPQYGASSDMVDIISNHERGGVVKEAARQAKAFFTTEKTPIGSLFIYISPEGSTGLVTDKGEPIIYPDSHTFVMVKTGEGENLGFTNYTIKTDFDLKECREVLFRLSGVVLPENASLEDYGRVITTVKRGERLDLRSPSDVIDVLKAVRKGPYIYKEKVWDEVYKEIAMADSLYDFSSTVQAIRKEFEAFCEENPYLDKLTYQKALVATILRISSEMLDDNKEVHGEKKNYGELVQRMAEIPGCAGGGGSTTAIETAGGIRLGLTTERTLKCKECPLCKEKDIVAVIANGKITCPKCGKSAPYDC